ncbi:MAG TPA: hypothetical protein PLH06_15140, partial [Candidatus Hydrogenedentes bacterium]|nr:hypothetical protein [Candidatus Hydrogenedentota bacterium]
LAREGQETGPSVRMDADELRLQPDLTSLLSGQAGFGRVIIRGGRLDVTLPGPVKPLSPSARPVAANGTRPASLKEMLASAYGRLPAPPNLPFRLSLHGCSARIAGLPVPGNTIQVDDLEADLYQPPDSQDRYLRLTGRVTVADLNLPFTCRVRASG